MCSRPAFDAAPKFLPLVRTFCGTLAGLVGGSVVMAWSAHAQPSASPTPATGTAAWSLTLGSTGGPPPARPKLPSVDALATPPDAATVPEPDAAFRAISSEVAGIFAKCKDAVVRIQAVDSYGMHAGTGFFIDPTGTVYTQYSVAGPLVESDGRIRRQEIPRPLRAGRSA